MHEMVRILAFCVMRTGSLRTTSPGHSWHILSSWTRCRGYCLPADGSHRWSGRTSESLLYSRIYWTMLLRCWLSFSGCGASNRLVSLSLSSVNVTELMSSVNSSHWVWNRCHLATHLCGHNFSCFVQGQCRTTPWLFPVYSGGRRWGRILICISLTGGL